MVVITDNFADGLPAWQLQTGHTNPKPTVTNGILSWDTYYDTLMSGSWAKMPCPLLKDYPMEVQFDLSCSSSNGQYYNGIALWVSPQHYICLTISKFMAGAGQTATVVLTGNEFGTGFNHRICKVSEDEWHTLKFRYDPETGAIYVSVDGTQYGRIAKNLLKANPYVSIISSADLPYYHTKCSFRNMMVAGVPVAGFAPLHFSENILNANGIDVSPELDRGVPYHLMGLTLKPYTVAGDPIDTKKNPGDGYAYDQAQTPSVDGYYRDAVYKPEGRCTTNPIIPVGLSSWRTIKAHAVLNGGSITMQVCNESGDVLPDSALQGNSIGFNVANSMAIDISHLSAEKYPRLSFKIRMTTPDSRKTPKLMELYCQYITKSSAVTY